MKRAFDHCADDYARCRPPYPNELAQTLTDKAGPLDDRWAADVGAGTGIFARDLASVGWRVVAIDPSPAMLQHIRRDATAAWIGQGSIIPLCATAETTGLADESVTLLAAAQAFHWFNPPYALAEFARILAPGGTLGLIWNNRDAGGSAFVEAFESLVVRYNPAYRREYRRQDWPGKIATCGGFESARYHRFDHLWRISAEGFVGFSRSVSYVRNVLSRQQRPQFEADLRELIRCHFGNEDCRIPLQTDLWTARRR